MTDPETQTKGTLFFGREVSKIPCYRSSLLTGISGGILGGLGFFMLTSNVRRATNVAMLGYLSTTVATWSICRYRWSKTHEDDDIIKDSLEAKLLMEGTELEKVIEAQSKNA